MKYELRTLRMAALFLGVVTGCSAQRTYTGTPIQAPYDIADLLWISDDAKTGFGAGLTANPFSVQCFTYQNGVTTPILTPGQLCQPQAANAGTYLYRVSPTNGPTDVLPPSQLFTYKNNQSNALILPDGVSIYPAVGWAGVNSSGQIALTLLCTAPPGFTGTLVNNQGAFCPYIISNTGIFTRLPADPSVHVYVGAINANGDIAGLVSPSNSGTSAPTNGNLVVWPQAGGMKMIANPANLQLGVPVAMNSKGQIIGPGYLYDGLSGIVPIQMPGATSTMPVSMNEYGEVVGTYRPKPDDGIDRPFYSFNGTAVDLNGLVPDLAKDKFISSVWYINNSGQILVTAVDIGQPVGVVANGTAATQFLLTPSNPLTTPLITRVGSAASLAPGTSSSSWITILGLNLSTTTRQWTNSDFANGKLPTSLDDVSVTINGVAAYIAYISPTQINVLAPDDTATGPVQVQVTNMKGTSASFTATKSDPMPGFFTVGPKPADSVNQAGSYIAALHGDGTPVGPRGLIAGANFTPAKQGEEIQLFGTGFGATTAPAPAGQLLTGADTLSNQVTVLIDGKPVQVVFAGRTANGLDQINVVVPSVFPDLDVAVQAKVNGATTQASVFLTVTF